jgi:hypothetical protein
MNSIDSYFDKLEKEKEIKHKKENPPIVKSKFETQNIY